MSAEDNVKIVQEIYIAFLRRDVPGILVHLDDHIIWNIPGSLAVPMAGVRKASQTAGWRGQALQVITAHAAGYIRSGGHLRCAFGR
jgi:hypothetical protein